MCACAHNEAVHVCALPARACTQRAKEETGERGGKKENVRDRNSVGIKRISTATPVSPRATARRNVNASSFVRPTYGSVSFSYLHFCMTIWLIGARADRTLAHRPLEGRLLPAINLNSRGFFVPRAILERNRRLNVFTGFRGNRSQRALQRVIFALINLSK